MTALTLGGLCSGIGGIEYAFAAAGFDTRWMVEINPFCRRVLEHHRQECWPNAVIEKDVFDVGRNNLSPVSVISAGFPCQPFSVAGSQRGTGDERFIWPEIRRIIDELYPPIVLLENVPGIRTNDGGHTFVRILRELNEGGYDAEWGHLTASAVGSPQVRERVFIVAYANGKRQSRTEDGNTAFDRERDNPTSQQSGYSECYEATTGCQVLGNTDSQRLQGQRTVRQQIMGARHQQRQLESTGHHRSRRSRTNQSDMGTDADGLSRRLVGHRWPAGQGDEQFEYEPPRTRLSKEIPDYKDRVEAVGNAVVPQVIYPIALAIKEYLSLGENREDRGMNTILFGNTVKEWRVKRKLSLRALAEIVGTSASTLSRIERGAMLDAGTFCKLLDWLDWYHASYFYDDANVYTPVEFDELESEGV